MSYYCSECGEDIEGHNHCCTAWPGQENPRRPFCNRCGKTLRLGFVESATCRCLTRDKSW